MFKKFFVKFVTFLMLLKLYSVKQQNIRIHFKNISSWNFLKLFFVVQIIYNEVLKGDLTVDFRLSKCGNDTEVSFREVLCKRPTRYVTRLKLSRGARGLKRAWASRATCKVPSNKISWIARGSRGWMWTRKILTYSSICYFHRFLLLLLNAFMKRFY